MHDNTALACPYYQHLVNGARMAPCNAGCWEEPRCVTEEPIDGWRPRDERGRFISGEAFEALLSKSGGERDASS